MTPPDPLTGWRSSPQTPSLSEVHRSISVPKNAGFFRKLLAYFGPGYLVAVGYMDPGNWATDLAGGAQFGYTLLSVILLSNLMAILLQHLCVKLGVVTGRDLAQACRDAYPKPVSLILWMLAELAIAACDLAEILGSAIGLKLLFGLPLLPGCLLMLGDVFLVLWLQGRGFRWLEALVIALIATVAVCFAFEIWFAKPDMGGVLRGFAPTMEIFRNDAMAFIAIGIIGATVMPHNLYLHSGLVQTRANDPTPEGKREAVKFASIDSAIALMLALFVNAAILILSASAFHFSGKKDVAEIETAYELLSPMLGVGIASTLFAVALLASGQNATVTGTLAGQIIMEGFLNFKIAPWMRRLITRGIAIVPAIIVIGIYGEGETGRLLVWSQVILGLQLPFAVIPLLLFTGSKRKMGAFVNPLWITILGWASAALILALNFKVLGDSFRQLGAK